MTKGPCDERSRHYPTGEHSRPFADGGRSDALLVTVRLACQILGLGRTSIHHLERSGQLKPVRIGTAVRFSVDHLREFVAARSAER